MQVVVSAGPYIADKNATRKQVEFPNYPSALFQKISCSAGLIILYPMKLDKNYDLPRGSALNGIWVRRPTSSEPRTSLTCI